MAVQFHAAPPFTPRCPHCAGEGPFDAELASSTSSPSASGREREPSTFEFARMLYGEQQARRPVFALDREAMEAASAVVEELCDELDEMALDWLKQHEEDYQSEAELYQVHSDAAEVIFELMKEHWASTFFRARAGSPRGRSPEGMPVDNQELGAADSVPR